MEKIMVITIPETGFGPTNWEGVSITQVIRGWNSWLVMSEICGQDNISPESSLYSTPHVPEEWVNRDQFSPLELDLEYESNSMGKPSFSLIREEEHGQKIFRAGTKEHSFFLGGVKIGRVELPDLPDIEGLPGKMFYPSCPSCPAQREVWGRML